MKTILLCIGCNGKIKPRAFLKKKGTAVKLAKFALKKAKGKKAKFHEIESASASVKKTIEDISLSKKASPADDSVTEVVLDMRVKHSNIFLMEIPVYSCKDGSEVEVEKADRIVLFALDETFSNPEGTIASTGDFVAIKYDEEFSNEKAIAVFSEKCSRKNVSAEKKAYLEDIKGLEWSTIETKSKKDDVYFLNEIEFAFLRIR